MIDLAAIKSPGPWAWLKSQITGFPCSSAARTGPFPVLTRAMSKNRDAEVLADDPRRVVFARRSGLAEAQEDLAVRVEVDHVGNSVTVPVDDHRRGLRQRRRILRGERRANRGPELNGDRLAGTTGIRHVVEAVRVEVADHRQATGLGFQRSPRRDY